MGIDVSSARGVAAVFRRLGVEATYRDVDDLGGVGVPVLVIPARADTTFDGLAQSTRTQTNLFEIQVAQVAVAKKGSQLTYKGEVLEVQNKPERPDGNRNVWRIDCAKV